MDAYFLKKHTKSFRSLIIWDMDGVIADTGLVKVGAFKKTFKANGVAQVHNDDQLLKSSRPSQVFREYSERCRKELSEMFHDFYREDIKSAKSFFTKKEWKKLSNNAVSVLCTAQPLAKVESTLSAIFGKSSADIFAEVITEEDLQGKSKSSEYGVQVISKILFPYYCSAINICFVGDSPDDLSCAKKIGAKSIAVAWGYYDQQELGFYKPSQIVHNYEQLSKCIMMEV